MLGHIKQIIISNKIIYNLVRPLKKLSRRCRLNAALQEHVVSLLPATYCIDIGASYYPHPAWEFFRQNKDTHWIAVEPNTVNLKYIDNWSWPSMVDTVKTGLSEHGGKQILYVTNIDSGSSLLKPVISDNMKHRIKSMDYFFPCREVEIDTLTLEQVFTQLVHYTHPVMIKLDTQGSEFSILSGLSKEKFLSQVIAVELENTLLAEPVMQGSTPFYQVYDFFEKSGYELVYIKPIEGASQYNINPYFNSKNVLNECDAVFLLRSSEVKARDLNYQLAMVGCYLCYSLYSEAAHLLEHICNAPTTNKETINKCEQLLKLIKL